MFHKYSDRFLEYLQGKLTKTKKDKLPLEQRLREIQKEFAALLRLGKHADWEVYEDILIRGYLQAWSEFAYQPSWGDYLKLQSKVETYEHILKTFDRAGEKLQKLEGKHGRNKERDLEDEII